MLLPPYRTRCRQVACAELELDGCCCFNPIGDWTWTTHSFAP